MLEAQMIQQGVNAMDTGNFAENTPAQSMPQEVQAAIEQGQIPGAMPVADMETEGGLPGTMGGMIPGQGLAGTANENGIMR